MRRIFLLTFLLLPIVSLANVSITEIMYDVSGSDTGREWIEISADSNTDVSNWKFFEANTNHGLTLIRGSAVIPAGGAAVIADNADKFLLDYPSFTGTLFDSSFSLNNTGETIAVRNADLVDIDSVLYNPALGAAGDGNSLQKTNSVWTAAAPTPGLAVVDDSPEGPAAPESSGDATAQSTGSATALQSIWADAGLDRTAIVGAGTIFEGKALGIDKKPLDGARYLWNFGDGLTGEGKKIIHTYKHPGDYIVYLDVANGSVSAGDKILVKAMPAEVGISALGYGEKSFVTISNGESVELDISLWQIKTGSGVFVVPKNTIIISNNKIIFSKDALGFEIKEGESVFLVYPNGSLAYEFPNSVITATINQATYSANSQKPEALQKGYKSSGLEEGETGDEADVASELTASVADSLPDSGGLKVMSKWLLGAFAIMAISVTGALAIRNYGRRDNENQEIKILE